MAISFSSTIEYDKYENEYELSSLLFGMYGDLVIADDSNRNKKSRSSLGVTFNCRSTKFINCVTILAGNGEGSFQRFQSDYFKTKEIEIFQKL